MKKFLSRILAISVIFVSIGAGCTTTTSSEAKKLSSSAMLEIWGVLDDEDAYMSIISDFRKSYPYVNVTYKKFRLEEYEDKLLNALAEDRGPDIFMIHNTWTTKYIPKIAPQPLQAKVAEQIVTGTIKKETTLEVRTKKTLTTTALRRDFMDVVAQDVIRTVNVSKDPNKKDMQERIFGIPMSVDTLGLYFNKDLLNAAGIPTAPTTWGDFQSQVERLTLLDEEGEIVRSGAGIGTGANVERSSDIVSLLMMQNRTVMTDDRGNIVFDKIPTTLSGQVEEAPGISAVRFYTDFANPGKSVYTWNAKQPNSLDAFTRGTSAFFIGYGYDLPLIRSRAPKLNLGITQVPQIENNPEVNFANYWMWTVSKKSDAQDLSWYFINFMTEEAQAKMYSEKTKRPPARRSLIEPLLDDADVGVFASQALTAKSWYIGADPSTMESVLIQMIDDVVTGTLDVQKSIKNAASKIVQTMQAQN